MALLSLQNMSVNGSSETFVACSGAGDSFPNDGKTYVHLKNTDAAIKTVTINSITPCNQGFDHNAVVTVPGTTGDVIVGPFDSRRFNDAATSQVGITYSAVVGLTVAVVRMP